MEATSFYKMRSSKSSQSQSPAKSIINTKKRKLPDTQLIKSESDFKENYVATTTSDTFSPEEKISKYFDADEENNNEQDFETFEERRLRNLRENELFLAQLQIQEDKSALQMSFGRVRSTPKTKKTYPKKATQKKFRLPQRKSERILLKIPSDSVPSDEPDHDNSTNNAAQFTSVKSKTAKSVKPENLEKLNRVTTDDYNRERFSAGPFPINDHLYDDTTISDNEHFLEVLRTLESDNKSNIAVSKNTDEFLQQLKKLKIREDLVQKVLPQRIFALTVHPSLERVIVCIGDKWGRLGFWDVDSTHESNIFRYEPHIRPIKNVAFHPRLHNQLYSCSYDGTMRSMHFEQGIFDEVLRTDDDISILGFDFHSNDTLLIGLSDGMIAVRDTRLKLSDAEPMRYTAHRREIVTVSVHPVNPHYFITSSKDASASLWDLRYMSQKGSNCCKSLDAIVHGKMVESAYFSPISGQRVLTTSLDDSIRIYDFETSASHNGSHLKLVKSVRHNNCTGRWLSNFRAVWHPLREDMFLIGSMDQPRRIELFSAPQGNLLHTFNDTENFNAVCSLVAFHSGRPVVVGGNSSGKVHVFM